MNDLLSLAWHVEAFARVKTLPRLESLLLDTEETTQREQPAEEMASIARRLNAAFGGTEETEG